MYFHIFFHPHVFLQMFSNKDFQFLNTCTKRALNGHKNVWLSIIHVALPLLFEKTSLISPQIFLQVYKKIFPIRWFLIGLLVARTVKLLRTKYAKRIAIVRIQKMGVNTSFYQNKGQVLFFLQNLAFRSFLLIFLVFYVLRGERHKMVGKIKIYHCF